MRWCGLAIGIASRLFVASSFCDNKFGTGTFFTGISDKDVDQTLMKSAFFRFIKQEINGGPERKRAFFYMVVLISAHPECQLCLSDENIY